MKVQKQSLPRTSYRSVRYRTSKNHLRTATANPSSLPKQLRLKKGLLLNISKTLEVNTPDADKSAYISTFNSMMSSTKNGHDTIQWSKKAPKVYIGNYQQQQDSQFTLLDVIKKPYTYLIESIDYSNKVLKQTNDDMKLISINLHSLQKQIIYNLEQIQKSTKSSIKQIKDSLHNNSIKQQQTKLRNKTKIKRLQQTHNNYQQSSLLLYQKTCNLQTDVFENKPFELINQMQIIGLKAKYNQTYM